MLGIALAQAPYLQNRVMSSNGLSTARRIRQTHKPIPGGISNEPQDQSYCSAVLVTFGLASTSLLNAATVTNTMPVKITIQNACNISDDRTDHARLRHAGSAGRQRRSDRDDHCDLHVRRELQRRPRRRRRRHHQCASHDQRRQHRRLPAVQQHARTTVWGVTVGTDTVTGTATAHAQTLTVYGRVPPQTTPPAAVYNDTVNVTVTY